jgi:hypothetical protein
VLLPIDVAKRERNPRRRSLGVRVEVERPKLGRGREQAVEGVR